MNRQLRNSYGELKEEMKPRTRGNYTGRATREAPPVRLSCRSLPLISRWMLSRCCQMIMAMQPRSGEIACM